MSLVGKIQSLFLDREKTQPIFPITKVEAVSDDNGNGLNVLLDDKASKDFVTAKIAEAQLGGGSGDIDLSGFATKDDLNAVNNKIPTTPEQIGAHPNTWLPTIAQIGAAPSWYGLGELGAYCDNCNNAMKNGWFWINGNTANIPNSGMSGTLFVETRNSSSGGVDYYQTITSGVQVYRRYYSSWASAWQPWVCENPPMEIGVEYRTAEWWGGNPVYTMLVNINSIATGTSTAPKDTTVDVTVNEIKKVVEYQVYITWNHETVSGLVYTASPNADNGIIATWTYARPDQNKLRVGVKANADVSGKTAHAIVKYIKG